MSNKENWIEEDGWFKLKRPGGGRREGILLISNDIVPYIYLKDYV
jgi:hypothetical protein